MVNEWTSNDVPSVSSLVLHSRRPHLDLDGKRFGAAVALDAVVEHLNANHPKPEPDRFERQAATIGELQGSFLRVEADAARWCRVHEIVEQERDQARASLRRLRDETDFDLFTVRDQLKQCRGEREQMTRERDEWRERAEAAEARTTITREDVEDELRITYEFGNDPERRIEYGADNMCALFGVEAGQATDPVEELAGQIEAATRTAIRQVCDDLATVAPSLDPLAVERAMEVTAASRKIAAHVLGQEAEQ